MLKYREAMNEDNTTDCQWYRKIQDDVEGVTEAGRLQVERSMGGEPGGDSRSENGVILRNLVKAYPCVFIKEQSRCHLCW